MFRHIVRGLIDAYGRTQFEFRRQRDPQLEAARPACFVEAAAVPHAASSLHPFDAAGRQGALDVVRVDIGDYAFRDIVRVAIPEWGWRGPLKGAPSWSKRSRNTNGFRISPKSDGLINRVTGPCVWPRVRCTIARAKRGGGDLAGARAIGVPLKIAWELESSSRSGGQDALARAAFKAAVHHSRSSISAPAGAFSSASPASTSPPW